MKPRDPKLGGYELSTGKIIEISGDGIGIGTEEDEDIFDGYGDEIGTDFTADEKREMAQYMISLWMKYGNLQESDL
jgi:hypothetical protein